MANIRVVDRLTGERAEQLRRPRPHSSGSCPQPPIQQRRRTRVEADHPLLAALPPVDADDALVELDIVRTQGERLEDPQPAAPEDRDQRGAPDAGSVRVGSRPRSAPRPQPSSAHPRATSPLPTSRSCRPRHARTAPGATTLAVSAERTRRRGQPRLTTRPSARSQNSPAAPSAAAAIRRLRSSIGDR
jgi:hypothetical protein